MHLEDLFLITGKVPAKKSGIDYYTPVNEPITYYNTIAAMLRRYAEATAEVGQKAPNDPVFKRWSCHNGLKQLCKLCRTFPTTTYGSETYDPGICMKALPLKWKYDHK